MRGGTLFSLTAERNFGEKEEFPETFAKNQTWAQKWGLNVKPKGEKNVLLRGPEQRGPQNRALLKDKRVYTGFHTIQCGGGTLPIPARLEAL